MRTCILPPPRTTGNVRRDGTVDEKAAAREDLALLVDVQRALQVECAGGNLHTLTVTPDTTRQLPTPNSQRPIVLARFGSQFLGGWALASSTSAKVSVLVSTCVAPSSKSDLARRRLINQRLVGPDPDARRGRFVVRRRPVAGLRRGEVGARPAHAGCDAALDRAFDAGEILRTHVLRPTWHFVAPADIRWMLALTGPRVHRAICVLLPPERPRREDLLARADCHSARAEGRHAPDARRAGCGAEESGHRCARRAPGTAGDARGTGRHHLQRPAAGQAVHLRAAGRARSAGASPLAGRGIGGTGRALLHEPRPGHGARLRLVVRSHREGRPVGHRDGRKALSQETGDGLTYWSSPNERARVRVPSPVVHLLPNYDECLIAYKDRGNVGHFPAPPDPRLERLGVFAHQMLLDGRMIGSWRRSVGRSGVALEVVAYRTLTKGERAALGDTVARHARFMNTAATVSVL